MIQERDAAAAALKPARIQSKRRTSIFGRDPSTKVCGDIPSPIKVQIEEERLWLKGHLKSPPTETKQRVSITFRFNLVSPCSRINDKNPLKYT